MGKDVIYALICIFYHKYANEWIFPKIENYHIILYTSLEMRANFRGDQPFTTENLRGAIMPPPPPGRTKTSNSPAFLGLTGTSMGEDRLISNDFKYKAYIKPPI